MLTVVVLQTSAEDIEPVVAPRIIRWSLEVLTSVVVAQLNDRVKIIGFHCSCSEYFAHFSGKDVFS